MATSILRSVLSVLALSSLVALSCAEQEESLYVVHAVPIDPEGCSANPSSVGQGWDTLDLSFDTGFVVALQLKNNLMSGRTSNSGIDDSEMLLRDVDVRLDIPQRPDLIEAIAAVDPSLVEFNSVLASDSISGQQESVVAVRIPPGSLDAIGTAVGGTFGTGSDLRIGLTVSIVVHALRASNELGGGVGKVEAREFVFPVDLCFNCLRDCSTCAGTCTDTEVGSGGVCGNAQSVATVPMDCIAP